MVGANKLLTPGASPAAGNYDPKQSLDRLGAASASLVEAADRQHVLVAGRTMLNRSVGPLCDPALLAFDRLRFDEATEATHAVDLQGRVPPGQILPR